MPNVLNSPATQQLLNYKVFETLYRGSRTTVYRGLAEDTQQPVVIKVLSQEYPSFAELGRFRNQYTIAKNLPIQGIVHPLGLEPYGNSYALVMENFEGVDLGQYAQQDALDLTETLGIAIQMAGILHELHQHRVIHKDIKPANILIHPESKQVKLIDFGIASLLPKETKTLQSPGSIEGTLAYLAPEQTGRMNRAIDYRTDFYALGVTLYQLLTGQMPFISSDSLELIYCHMAKQPIAMEQHKPDIPAMVSAIVAKLMAKNAEDRYQSALGLKHDLERCLIQWNEQGEITDFALGQWDLSDRFTIPEKLYGREAEVQTLLNAFERVSQGASELMLVSGFSGIGKTAVINEVHKPIVRQRGYFIKGKFDQLNRNIPFSAFVQAFQDLAGQLLSESDAELETWKAQILAALGGNAQVIIELIPELERIIGEQPPVPELSGTAAQNRFNLLFQKFIRVFTAPEHPLVIFLDDLQWADLASLNLIQVLMLESQTGYLLLLGAYRDNEVFPAHPFMRTLDDLQLARATLNTITLQPLSATSLNHLISDTLHAPEQMVQPLADLVMQKTQGNPFFTTQFLKAIHQDQLITFNYRSGYWQCDIVKVQDAALTSDVVEFMASQLQKLPEVTQDVLKLAACIGAQFDLETLAIVSERSQTEVATALWQALQKGIVLPQSDVYKFYLEADSSTDADNSTHNDTIQAKLNYRFLHDRIQQAAYSLIPQTQKSLTHYKLGQLLFESVSVEVKDDQLFEIVNNLNYGIDFIESRQEQIQIAKLNLRAAHKAKKSIAYSTAVDFLNMGIHILGETGWSSEYSLIFELHKECSETEYLAGNLEQAENLAHQSLKQAKSAIDKAEIYNILIVQHTVTAQYQDAINEGKIALNSLGIQWHDEELHQDLKKELEFAKHQLGDRDIASLIDLPEMELTEKRSAIKILHNLLPPTFSVNQDLWKVLVVKMVNLSLQYGHIAECCFGYSFYGVLVSSIFEDYQSGYEFGTLSLNLSRKFKDLAQESKACNILAAFLLHWQKPVNHCESVNDRGYEAGLESGQLQFIGYIAYNRTLSLFHSGKNLNDLLKEFSVYLPVLEEIKHYYAYDIMIGCQVAISSLMSPQSEASFNLIQDVGECEYLETFRKRNSFPAICIFNFLKAQILYLFNSTQEALESLLSAKEFIDFISGHFTVADYNYYYSLILLEKYSNASCREQSEIVGQVKDNQIQIKIWARNCPDNFQHKADLVDAEIARNHQDRLIAIEMYDRAISGAKANGFIQDEALANELAAKFYLDWGKEKLAAVYMQEAYYCYVRWGAKAKVADLEARYPDLLNSVLQSSNSLENIWDTLATLTLNAPTTPFHSLTYQVSSSSGVNQALDFTSIFKASQSLSSTIQLDELLRQLTQIILQNSGGDRCALILPNEVDEWQVRAIATAEDNQLCTEPLEAYQNLPVKLIQYVKNIQEVVVIDELETDLPVLDDYLNQQQPNSVLGLPILNQGRCLGVLALENQLTSGVFAEERILVLNFLCTQAAISLENARLYQQVQQSLTDLQQAQLQIVQSEKMSALGGLVAGVAHEINNPVGCILGNVGATQGYISDLLGLLDLYTEQFPEPGPDIEDELEEIDLDYVREDLPKLVRAMKDSGDRIKSISKSLRTFSRADTDEKQSFNLHEGIDSTVLILRHRLKANEQRPEIEVIREYGDIPEIDCFPGQLNQVFMNVLANAIDALDEASQHRSLKDMKAHPHRITIRTTLANNQVNVAISDNGPGVPEKIKAKIFDHLFTTKAVSKGTGLGLAIARQIVEETHGGTLKIQSEVDQGAEFRICLPLQS